MLSVIFFNLLFYKKTVKIVNQIIIFDQDAKLHLFASIPEQKN